MFENYLHRTGHSAIIEPEMPATTPGPRVLDLTAPQRAARLEFDASPAYELIAVLQALSTPSEWNTYEQGATWFDELRSRMSDQLRSQLELVPGEGCRAEWGHLAGLIAEAPDRSDVRRVIDHLAALPATAICRSLIESSLPGAARREHSDLIEAAAHGDKGARARLREIIVQDCCGDDSVEVRLADAILATDPQELRDRMIAGLREAAGLLGDHLAAVMPVLRRDAEARRERVRGMPIEDAVENASDGIHYALEPGIRRVLMVPHAGMRPWVLISEHLDTKIFMVAVSEASLSADLDTPPARLVQMFKALAEEQRLRILRRLAVDGPATLQEIADHLGVAKSTAHHHLVQLRAAGLTVVDLGAERNFRIRDGVAEDVRRLLETYLRAGAR